MKTVLIPLYFATLAIAGPAAAQPAPADCNAHASGGHWAYLVLDQSERSDAFRAVLKNLVRPEMVAVSAMKGDYSSVGINAERHPLAFVLDRAGPARKFDDPAEFTRAVNEFARCSRS